MSIEAGALHRFSCEDKFTSLVGGVLRTTSWVTADLFDESFDSGFVERS